MIAAKLPLSLSLCLLIVSGGCLGHGSSEQTAEASTGEKDKDKNKEETAVPVEVETVARGPIEAVLRLSTNLEAEEEVQVHAQAARLVRVLLVEEGDQVQQDQVLLRLQDDEQRSALAKIQSQFDKARREHERNKELYERELISQQAFSESTYSYEQLKIALEDARREMSYTEVRAPIGGTITRRLVNVGDLVSINQHLFDLVDFDTLVAPVYVPEKELARLGVGQEARLSAQALGDKAEQGFIKRIAPVVDPKSGTVKVTVGIKERHDLRPGMYVEVALVTATHADAVLVSKRALVYDKDQVYVYRLKDKRRVERVMVEPVLADKLHVEPASGLAAGDQIVVAGQAGLKDQALVRLPGDPEPTPKPADEA